MTRQPTLTNYPNNSEAIQGKFGKIEGKKFAAVIDLELTCWEDSALTKSQGEITEIGVVLVDMETLDIVGEYTSTVKPKNFPELTEYCTNLTGITQDEIDSSRPLNEVYKELCNTFLPNQKEFFWVVWGRDTICLENELNSKGQKVELDPRVMNLKEVTRELKIHGGLKAVLESLSIEQVLPHHRALPDAKSTYKLMKHFNVTKEDVMISNNYSYKQAVDRFKKEQIFKLTKQTNMSKDKAEKLLNILDWNYTKAREVSLALLR